MKTSLILCLLFATVCFAGLNVTLDDAAVRLGSEIVIPCLFETDDPDPKQPEYAWYKVIEKTGEVFKIAPSEANKRVAENAGMSLMEDGSLKIAEATWVIAENFTKLACDVEIGRSGFQRSNTMTLQVIDAPDQDADITIEPPEGGENGFSISEINTLLGECTSPSSFPAAVIKFYKNGQSLISPIADSTINALVNSDNVYEDPNNPHKFISTRSLLKRLDESDHRAEFVCNVKVEFNGQVYFEKNKTMPQVNVRYQTDMAEWEEEPVAYLGETITLRCNANGFPDPTVTINGVEGKEIEITITSDMDGMTYKCSAQNALSEEAAESSVYTINVLSAEEPTVSGEKYMNGKGVVSVDQSATFECAASGNPQPTVAWYDAKGAKVSNDGTLEFSKASLDQTATYTCKSFAEGHEKLGRSTTLELEVQGITVSGADEETMTGKEGESVLLDCAVNANPKPTFTWDFEDAKPTETKTEQHTYTSQVTVGPLKPELSQKEFTCTAQNDVGTVTKKFVMPEIASASGATTGIIIAILLIILVVAIVLAVLYNKGIICKKGEKGDESAEGDIALEINNDEGDVEAGNGKPAAPVEEENEPSANPEEEKLMNPDEVEK